MVNPSSRMNNPAHPRHLAGERRLKMRTGNTTQINVTIPKDLNNDLRQEAKKENRSFSNFVASLLIEAMQAREEAVEDAKK